MLFSRQFVFPSLMAAVGFMQTLLAVNVNSVDMSGDNLTVTVWYRDEKLSRKLNVLADDYMGDTGEFTDESIDSFVNDYEV